MVDAYTFYCTIISIQFQRGLLFTFYNYNNIAFNVQIANAVWTEWTKRTLHTLENQR